MLRTLLTSFLLIICCTPGYSQKGLYTPAQEWPVKITDGWFTAKTISWGLYTTADRKNGIADATAVGFIKDPVAPFNFMVSGQDEKILVQELRALHIAFSNRSLPSFLDNMPATAPYSYVQINGTKNEPLKRWELILKEVTYLELNDNKPAGILRSEEDEIRITAHNNFGTKNSYENICYEFHYRRKEIAAVIPGEKPRVWMSADMPAALQPILAAAIGALLLR
jgi:hypothetical protein